MKRFLLPLLLVFAVISCDKVDPSQEEDGRYPESAAQYALPAQKAEAWLGSLTCRKLGGRKTGSEYDRLAFEYLKSELTAMGLAPEVQTFDLEGTECRNLIVSFDFGKDSTIIVGSHYDGAEMSNSRRFYPAAEDNASGCVANLTFLSKVVAGGLDTDYNVICCFWDAEEAYQGSSFNGSRYFIQNFAGCSKVALYINLDTLGHEIDDVELLRSDRVQELVDALVAEGIFDYIVRNPFSGASSDYVSFRDGGIPYIAVHDVHSGRCRNNIHTVKDVPEAISIEKLIKVSDVTRSMVEKFRRYE